MKATILIRRMAQWVVFSEVWLVVALAAVSVVTDRFLVPAIIVAAAFWSLRWLARGHLSVRTPLDLPVGALALLMPVTLLATPLPEITRPQVYRLLLGIALCYALANHAWTPLSLRAMLGGYISLAVGLSLASLVTVKWVADKLEFVPIDLLANLPKMISEQFHPNVMEGALVVLALLGPGWLLFEGRQLRWWGWVFLLLAAAFSIGVLVFTQTRGAWLGLAAGLALLVILRWPRWGTATVLIVGLIGGAYLITNAGLVQTLMDGDNAGGNNSKLQTLLDIWTRSVKQIKAFPLTGMGMGTFPQVTRALYPNSLVIMGDNLHTHNLYLQIAIDLGLPGLAAWLAAALMVQRCAWQVYRVGLRQQSWLAGLGAGLIAAQTALLIHGLVDAVTWGTRPAIVVWGVWGLTLGSWVMIQCNIPSVIPQSQTAVRITPPASGQ